MQTLIAIIPLKGKLSDNRFKFPKNFTKLGYSLICCCIITTICSILLFIKSEKDNDDSQNKLHSELSNRDSINQIKFDLAKNQYIEKLDSNNKNTIELLAKYGLKYDSAAKRIEKLVKDSTNRQTTIINSEDPNFDLCKIQVERETNDSLFFKMTFCSENATSYDIDFKLDLISKIGRTKPYFYLIKELQVMHPKSIINKGKYSSLIMGIKNIKYCRIYFFHIRGSYKKFDHKLIPLESIIAFDFDDPKPHFGPPNSIIYNEIVEFMSNKK